MQEKKAHLQAVAAAAVADKDTKVWGRLIL